MKKKVLVILGAGASHGVWDGRIPKNDDWQPPLASGLFDFSKKHYLDLALRYSGAKALGSIIMQQAGESSFDLEETLRGYASAQSGHTAQWFKHIPPYIRDLLTRCSDQYVSVPVNYTVLLHKLINESDHEPAFVVLNYDTLLEQALNHYPLCRFDKIDDYVCQEMIGPLVKLHGSINWFVPIGPVQAQWESRVAVVDVFEVAEEEILVIDDQRPTTKLRFGDGPRHFLYPRLTAPLAGKDPNHYVCPTTHIEKLKEWGRDCAKVLIIGCSGKDDNLMTLLSEALVHVELAHYVGSAKGLEDVHRRFRDSVRPLHDSSAGTLFIAGFRRYVNSDEFRSFCSH